MKDKLIGGSASIFFIEKFYSSFVFLFVFLSAARFILGLHKVMTLYFFSFHVGQE